MRMKLKTVLITTSLFLLVLVLIVFENVIYQTFETWGYDDDYENRCREPCLFRCDKLPDGTCRPCRPPSCNR